MNKSNAPCDYHATNPSSFVPHLSRVGGCGAIANTDVYLNREIAGEDSEPVSLMCYSTSRSGELYHSLVCIEAVLVLQDRGPATGDEELKHK